MRVACSVTIMKLRSESTEAIDRFRMLFMNDSRTCTFKEQVPELIIGGRKLGPFQSGEQAYLPNWAVEQLVTHGLANIAPEDAYESLRRLLNLHREEEKQPHKLQTFHPFLYAALNRKMHRLQEDRTSMDPRRYEEIERMQRMIPFLVETRLSKIIRVAKSGAYQEKRKQMTNEERWLCEEIAEILSVWRTKVME